MDWYGIQGRQSAAELRRHGPSTLIAIGSPKGGVDVRAQISTGHPISLVRPGLAKQHGLFPLPTAVPSYRIHLILPGGILEFGAVETEIDPPHDLILGRDVLKTCRLQIDFNAGKWELQIGMT